MTREELIKKIHNFQYEQQRQKLRGLNNYNIMKVLRKPHAEVGMHSNFIYSLLDVDGVHYQGDLFARLFAKHVLSIDNIGENIKVCREENANGRRIDFTIKSDKYFIGIEMKIYANDEHKQISDYYDYLSKKAKEKQKEVKIYYLTLDGKKASCDSHQDKSYIPIAFNNEIIKWLKESKKQISNITNLNNAIGYYIDIVNMLIGKYKSPISQYEDFFLNDKDVYEAYTKNKDTFAKDPSVEKGFIKAKQNLNNNFYSKLLSPILDEYLYFKAYYENSENGRKTDGDIVIMELFKKYDLRLFIKKDKFVSICIGINNQFNFGDNEIKLKYQNIIGNELSEYKIGRKKGVKLRTDITIPKNTIENLFLAYYNRNIDELDNNIVKEIQKHIEIIKEKLKKLI